MNAENSNTMIVRRLREGDPMRRSGVRLPRSIEFNIDGGSLRMSLDPSCVIANMQEDKAAFEAWALTIKCSLPEVRSVELSWQVGGNGDSSHYQRFLYRVKNFRALFPAWFSLSPSGAQELGRLKTDVVGDRYLLNTSKERVTPPLSRCNSLLQALSSEHRLECFIADNSKKLKTLLRMDTLHRQCPVGVFRNKVKTGPDYEIFPRRHSAIDLWGVDDTAKKLFLFELKKPGNTHMGILSELLFYSCVMEDVQKGRFKFEKPNEEISSTDSISMYMLACKWHPLIDEGLLQVANEAFRKNGRRIRFGAVKIDPEKPKIYTLELQACD